MAGPVEGSSGRGDSSAEHAAEMERAERRHRTEIDREVHDSVAELMRSMPVALTPQAVLLMLQRRLNALDDRIGQVTRALEDSAAAAEREQEVLNLLQELKIGGNSSGVSE